MPTSASAAGDAAVPDVVHLTTNGADDPLGIETAVPQLGWRLAADTDAVTQSAYEVRVASDPGLLAAGRADVWDSGEVSSANSVAVDYDGPALRSGVRYYWDVRVWDGAGQPSAWSAQAWWEMGLLSASDWSGAKWIGRPTPWPAGTVASASSYHAASPSTTYFPANAIDGDTDTYWNDNTPGAYPDVLTVTAPKPLTLPGVTVVSSSAGWMVDFTVDTWDGSSWVRQATVTGNEDVTRLIPFDVPVTTTEVRITSTGDRPENGEFSRIAELVPGLYVPPRPAAPLLRKDVTLVKPVQRARVYVSGLGYDVLNINGRRVGDRVLDPAFTDYEKRVLYQTYDVTSYLRGGQNVIGVTLGRGFFGLNSPNLFWTNAPWRGEPRLLLKLVVDYADGSSTTVVSDGSWQEHDGPTTEDSIYAGETYDARRELPGWDRPGYDASGWQSAKLMPAPAGALHAQQLPPIRVVDTMRAEQITNPEPGTYVFKFPAVTAGWARLRAAGAAGTEITLRYGETLNSDGTVNNAGDSGITVGPIQTDRYILADGDKEQTWEPQFSYKGFQYVQVDGYPGIPSSDSVVARVVHTDVPSVGNFTSSNTLLNEIHGMARRTILNNLHGIKTDTPMYEKRGWLDAEQLMAPSSIDNFDMRRFYRKSIDDMADNQAANGNITDLVPAPAQFPGDDPIWDSAVVLIPWDVYQGYGDTAVLSAHYGGMRAYVNYLRSTCPGLICSGYYGDWSSPNYTKAPEGSLLSSTAYFYRDATVVAQAARALGNEADASTYERLAADIKSVFNARFLDAGRGLYRTDIDVGYRQTSNALPLAFGMVPQQQREAVAANLAADVEARGDHLNTGEAGTQALLPALTANGYVDVAYALASQRTTPSWGAWAEQGATTFWEAWVPPIRSHDHDMLGSIDDWFYSYLAGIQPSAPGYQEIRIKPYVPLGLDSASGSIDTVRGTVASAWQANGDMLTLRVSVPANATATIYVPATTRGDVQAGNAAFERMDDGYALFTVGSGTYEFHSRLPLRLGVDLQPLRLYQGQSASVNVDVTNPSNRPLTTSVTATPDAPLQVSPTVREVPVPASSTATATFQVSVPEDAPANRSYRVTFAAGGVTAGVDVHVYADPGPLPPPKPGDIALEGTATASSTYPGFSASKAIDGNKDPSKWGPGSDGWNDATADSYPDWLQVSFAERVRVSQVVVYTFPPAGTWGLIDYDVQVLNGMDDWVTVAEVRNNAQDSVPSTFDPVGTTAVRILVHAARAQYSRILELEIYSTAQGE